MPQAARFKAGALTGTLYTYARIGDTLPVHTHDEANNHVTVIMDGSFRCSGNPAIEGKVLRPGQVVVWPVGAPHGFEALEAGSRMLQLPTGLPTGQDNLV